MSPPAPCTVQVPPLSDWLPARAGLPMSAQLHGLGQEAPGVPVGVAVGASGVPVGVAVGASGVLVGVGLAAADVETLTVSKVAVPRAPVLCEVTAMPASMAPLMLIVTLEPGTAVQVLPLLEV